MASRSHLQTATATRKVLACPGCDGAVAVARFPHKTFAPSKKFWGWECATRSAGKLLQDMGFTLCPLQQHHGCAKTRFNPHGCYQQTRVILNKVRRVSVKFGRKNLRSSSVHSEPMIDFCKIRSNCANLLIVSLFIHYYSVGLQRLLTSHSHRPPRRCGCPRHDRLARQGAATLWTPPLLAHPRRRASARGLPAE